MNAIANIWGRKEGGAMIFALIVLIMGTLGIASWVSIIAARSSQVEVMEQAIKRRVALHNARAMARDYALRNVVTKTSGTGFTVTLADGWGEMTIPNWSGSTFASTTRPGVFNRISPANGYGYIHEITASLNNGSFAQQWLLQARSRSPVLAGDLLSVHSPTLSPTASVGVEDSLTFYGRSVYWDPDLPDQLLNRTDSYTTPVVPLPSIHSRNASGATNLLNNFPLTPTTAGEVNGWFGYDGLLSCIDNPLTPDNSVLAKVLASNYVFADGQVSSSERGVASNGVGTVTIDLDDPLLPNVWIHNNTWRIVFEGQNNQAKLDAAGNLPAVTIVATQDLVSAYELVWYSCRRQNNRRLHLAVKKNGPGFAGTFYFSQGASNPSWRMMVTAENAPLNFDSNTGRVTLTGGVRADRSLSVTGRADFVRDLDPQLLERMADRNAWVECYAN